MNIPYVQSMLGYSFTLIVFAALSFWPVLLQAQHVHVNAGAPSTTLGTPLYFRNGSTYDTNAGYDVYLSFTNGGSFAGLYQGAGVTFAALASTLDNGGPAPGHAADGAFLQLQFVSISGPPGGVFGVWMQQAGSTSSSDLLFTLPAGTSNGSNLLPLSESDASPGSDPYGHIHGRTFTATKPGLYRLGCRILDTSANGPGGGPIHTPSPLYYFYFQAGLAVGSWSRNSNAFGVTFGTTVGTTYYVESTTNLATASWATFAGPLTGDNYLHTAATNSALPQLFFRLRTN
jgi:hypothetical protein